MGYLAGTVKVVGLIAVAASASWSYRPCNALHPRNRCAEGRKGAAADGHRESVNRWERPVSAFGFSVSDDPAIHRVVFFGSVDGDAQTWLWDGSRWSRSVSSVSPPARFHAANACDPPNGLVMLFGGRLHRAASAAHGRSDEVVRARRTRSRAFSRGVGVDGVGRRLRNDGPGHSAGGVMADGRAHARTRVRMRPSSARVTRIAGR